MNLLSGFVTDVRGTMHDGSGGGQSKMNLQQGLSVEQLREMAARQQQQIEMQQQQLVAKEQRLKYLKQQEYQHHQMASEYDRLRRYSRQYRHTDCVILYYSSSLNPQFYSISVSCHRLQNRGQPILVVG